MGACKSKQKKSLDEALTELESALDKHNAAVSAAWGLPVMEKPSQHEVDELLEQINAEVLIKMKSKFPPAGTNPVA